MQILLRKKLHWSVFNTPLSHPSVKGKNSFFPIFVFRKVLDCKHLKEMKGGWPVHPKLFPDFQSFQQQPSVFRKDSMSLSYFKIFLKNSFCVLIFSAFQLCNPCKVLKLIYHRIIKNVAIYSCCSESASPWNKWENYVIWELVKHFRNYWFNQH